jgi:hypothetical protein
VTKVKELRDFLKKTGFIKVSKIKQAKKHSQQKGKIPTDLSASIYASRLLDKYLVLEPFTILKRQTTLLTSVTLDHFSRFSHF